MWNLTPEQHEQRRALAKDAAHVALFLVALAFFIYGGLLSHPADLGLIGSGMGILAVIGIARA